MDEEKFASYNYLSIAGLENQLNHMTSLYTNSLSAEAVLWKDVSDIKVGKDDIETKKVILGSPNDSFPNLGRLSLIRVMRKHDQKKMKRTKAVTKSRRITVKP